MIEIQQLSWNHRSTDGYINTTSLKHPSSFHARNLPVDQHLFNKFTTSGISNEAITFNIMSHRDIPSMWSTNLEAAPKARFSRITTNPLHHQGTQVMAVVSTLHESITGLSYSDLKVSNLKRVAQQWSYCSYSALQKVCRYFCASESDTG